MPSKFQEALQTIFQGDDSLRIPVQQFNDYFNGKSMDPAAVAGEIGASNYADVAATPGGYVEVPVENFLGKLDPEHQQGLLPDVVDPASGLTLREHQGLQQWRAQAGPAELQAELTQSDPETVATPEWQMVQEDPQQQDAGFEPGTFSIFDWSGYPPWAPRPTGTFRLLPDAEYKAARNAANRYLGATHRADRTAFRPRSGGPGE